MRSSRHFPFFKSGNAPKNATEPADQTSLNPLAEINTLVYSGTGAAIFGQNGVKKGLEKDPDFSFNQISKILGVSGGSLTALTDALELNFEETDQLLKKVDFTKITGKARPGQFFSDYGLFTADIIYQLVLDILKQKFPDKDPKKINFHDIKEKYNKSLYVYTAKMIILQNTPRPEGVVFSPEYYGNTSVAAAIKASISAPPVFPAVFMKRMSSKDSNGKRIKRAFREYRLMKNPDKHTDCFTDGGSVDNFPIDYFDHIKYLSEEEQKIIMASGQSDNISHVVNPHVLGITPISNELMIGKEHKPVKRHIGRYDPKTFYTGLINGTMHNWLTQGMAEKHVASRTIEVARDLDTFDFERSQQTRLKQYQNGEDALALYKAGKDPEQTPNPPHHEEESGEYLPANTKKCLPCLS